MLENKGVLEVRITGKKGLLELKPELYDISEIKEVLSNVEKLLFPAGQKTRPQISYEIQEGSVKHLFKTSLQAIIGFNALIGQIQSSNSIDFLEHPTAQAIQSLQTAAYKQNYEFELTTSAPNTNRLSITPHTNFQLTKTEWVDAEFYLYGDIVDMGGKNKANIHISSPGVGSFIIETPRETLRQYETNPLYKPLGIRAVGKQNLSTGELDPKTLKFKEFITYSPIFDSTYLDSLINAASNDWVGVENVDEWLHEMREG